MDQTALTLTEDRAKFTPIDPKVLTEYRREMVEKTIPAIVEDIHRREIAATVTRQAFIRTN